MRRRLDLFGRLLLILVGSVLLLGAASVSIILVHNQRHRDHVPAFSRIRQAAGLIDWVAGPNAPPRDLFRRVANGSDMSATIVATPPPMPGLQQASRLTAKLQGFMRTRTSVTAYIDPRYVPAPRASGIEGYLAGAIAQLPNGQILVLTTNATGDAERPRLLGLPASLWMAGLSVLVVILALWLTARETRPLRNLVRATRLFDGTAVTTGQEMIGAADIRRTTEAVTDMQQRVIDLLGERSLMVGAISHDLRTLLTRMRLRVAVLDDPSRSRLESDLDGMDAMLSDALAFARGTTASVRERVDLADIAASEVAERQVRDVGTKINIVLDDAPCIGDAHALRRVIANLLDNAIKYGRGHVRLAVDHDGNHARLLVEDNGPGIPPDQRAAVLAPYYRGDHPEQRRLAGSGLGLAIVQQIVRAHRGTVTISGSSLGGAMVTVKISCGATVRVSSRGVADRSVT